MISGELHKASGKLNPTDSSPFSIVLVAVSSPTHYTLWNALAVESLAGDLRGAFGKSTTINIFRVRSGTELEDVYRRLERQKPDAVGISVECGGVELSLKLAGRISAWGRNGKTCVPRILFGGKIPTYFPELFLRQEPSAVVVLGEGELPLRSIIAHWLGVSREPVAGIPNLAFCDTSSAVVRTRPEQPLAQDLIYPLRSIPYRNSLMQAPVLFLRKLAEGAHGVNVRIARFPLSDMAHDGRLCHGGGP